MSRGRLSKFISVVITGIIAISGLPSMVLADVINAPTYYSVQSDLSYEITTNITSSWINHESIDLVLANTGSETIHNWYLTFNIPYNIDNIWNGTLYETDGNGTYTITSNGWNQDIHTGESVTVGITFSSDTEEELSVDPEWYLLNTQATIVDASQYTLEYIEYSAWETGFTGQLTLTPQVDCQHWELSFDSNREITAVSSAVLISDCENNYAITHDENNMSLLANNAYNFGIQGVNTEDPLELSTVELTAVDLAYHLTDDADSNGVPDYLDFIGGGSIIDPTPTPTPVPTETPTEEPTVTPTTEPTGTETPTTTEEPTPTPIIDYEADQDLDGLPDYYEEEIGTNPLRVDTDDDELSDYIEIIIGYDPTYPDSDSNGITDGNEDFDNDGLSNTQELQLGTELCFEDTDGDNLTDGDEINIHGTDPLVPDTDGDGIKDGDEVSIGKNPSDSSDGATRIPQTFTWTISNPEDAAITSVDVSISVANRIDRVVDVDDYYNVDVYSTGVYGRIGSPLNFECDEDFDTATVVIHYDESSLGDTLEEELGVLWFDEESGFYITQDQAVIDTANNTVTLVLEHFSTYVLVNLNLWNNPQLTPIASTTSSIRTVVWSTPGVYYDSAPIIETNDSGQYVLVGWTQGTIAPERNERNAWNEYLATHPNDVCVETVNMRAMQYSWGGMSYMYTWKVYTADAPDTDNDHDGVPDTLEVNGIYAVGQGDDLYTSHVDEESGVDSDGDLVPDLEEYRAIYIISKSSDDGSVSVTRISANGQEILDSDTGFYNLAISYVDSVLDPGETFAFCTPRSNPDDPDSDDDNTDDYNDLHPLKFHYQTLDLGGGTFDYSQPDNGFIHITSDAYGIEYGGAQGHVFLDEYYPNEVNYAESYNWPSYQNDLRAIEENYQAHGCGYIALVDVIAYDNEGSADISSDEFTEYLRMPFSLDNFMITEDGVFVYSICAALTSLDNYNRALWRFSLSKRELISLVEDLLSDNTPVIMAYYGTIGLNLYELTNRTNSNESIVVAGTTFYRDVSNTVHEHYFVVTGIIFDSSTDEYFFRISSWGREYIISVRQYLAAINDTFECIGSGIVVPERG